MTRPTTTAATTAIFGLDLAGEINAALGPLLQPATLVIRGPRVRATGNLAGGTRSTETRVPCRGLREITAQGAGSTAAITLLGASLVSDGARQVPQQGDAIEIGGEAWEVTGAVADDPAAATYTCACARVRPGMP